MSNSTSLYPRVRVDQSASGVVSHAGSVLLTATAARIGLDEVMSRALAPWRPRLAVHDPGKVVVDLAVALAIGGDCLADIAVLRAEPGLFGFGGIGSDGVAHHRSARSGRGQRSCCDRRGHSCGAATGVVTAG